MSVEVATNRNENIRNVRRSEKFFKKFKEQIELANINENKKSPTQNITVTTVISSNNNNYNNRTNNNNGQHFNNLTHDPITNGSNKPSTTTTTTTHIPQLISKPSKHATATLSSTSLSKDNNNIDSHESKRIMYNRSISNVSSADTRSKAKRKAQQQQQQQHHEEKTNNNNNNKKPSKLNDDQRKEHYDENPIKKHQNNNKDHNGNHHNNNFGRDYEETNNIKHRNRDNRDPPPDVHKSNKQQNNSHNNQQKPSSLPVSEQRARNDRSYSFEKGVNGKNGSQVASTNSSPIFNSKLPKALQNDLNSSTRSNHSNNNIDILVLDNYNNNRYIKATKLSANEANAKPVLSKSLTNKIENAKKLLNRPVNDDRKSNSLLPASQINLYKSSNQNNNQNSVNLKYTSLIRQKQLNKLQMVSTILE